MARKQVTKRRGPAPHREVSVLAWIQDAYGNVLLVEQFAGRKLWTLPGGKVRAHEPLARALRRELKEEIGLSVFSAQIIDLYDRPARGGLAILFRVVLRKGKIKLSETEIRTADFIKQLPSRSTPSARYFWPRHRSPAGSASRL